MNDDAPRKLQKDDVPTELWPMYDAMDFATKALAHEMEHVIRHRDRLQRARVGSYLSIGFCLATGITNIAFVILRP